MECALYTVVERSLTNVKKKREKEKNCWSGWDKKAGIRSLEEVFKAFNWYTQLHSIKE